MPDYTAPDKDLPNGPTDRAAPNITQNSASSTFETASGFDASKASGDSIDNVFYVQYAVFLEGIEVPCSNVAISYGINGIPACEVTMPASKLLRDLPQTTKIAVFFKDLVPNDKGIYEWRLLFDGEYSGHGYAVAPNGASITLTFMHNAAHMHSMQLMTMDMTEFWLMGGNQYSAGGAVLVSTIGFNKPTKTILKSLLDEKNASNFKSMADIVYTLVRTTIADVKNTPTGKYFKAKFGDDVVDNEGGYKLLRRFFGISDSTRAMVIPEAQELGDTGTGATGGQRYYGSKSMYPDQPRVNQQVDDPSTVYEEDKAKKIVDRANQLADKKIIPEGFGNEGCARAANYMITGGFSYPYSAEADMMAIRVSKENGGCIFADQNQLRPGDMVFYQNTYGSWEPGTVTHVAIYVGNGEIVHQPTAGKGVVRSKLDTSNVAYYGRSYARVS